MPELYSASNIMKAHPDLSESFERKKEIIKNSIVRTQPVFIISFSSRFRKFSHTVEDRAVPFYTLAIIHSIFMRLHNNIAEELLKLNPNWNDEKLYQESRRIVIALHQHVVYNEWIPTLFGNII